MGQLEQISFRDLESGSQAYLLLRITEGGLALSLTVEADGDLDLKVSRGDARRLAEAILAAGGDNGM